MDAKTIVKVTNRSTARVYYKIPEMNVRREFLPRESKKVTAGEVAAVCQQSGGRELFYNFLQVDQDSEDVLHDATNLQEAPEYWLTEDMIPDWLSSSSIDEFTDALHYAPIGVKDLIKKYSVSQPLNDMNKRQIIQQILNFDVTAAIAAATPDPSEVTPAAQVVRKTVPNYKILTPKK